MNDSVKQTTPLEALAQAEASFQPEVVARDPVDSLEDVLELSETIQVTRNYLAERYHEIHPAPDALPEEHRERLVSHAHFLKDVGKISVKDWDAIGLGNADNERNPETTERLVGALNAIAPRYVSSLTRPDWEEHFPKADDPERTTAAWNSFKAGYPEDMQVMLEELHQSTEQLHTAQESSVDMFREFQQQRESRFNTLMAASCVRALTRSAEDMRDRADQLRRTVVEGTPSKAVLKRADELETQARHFEAQAGQFFVTGTTIDSEGREKPALDSAVEAELARRARLDDRRELRHGLLMTRDMKQLVSDLLPQALDGKPILLVGDTGGAKTAAAEYLAQQVNKQLGKDPNAYEFVSGYGQMNSYQLMGKDTIRTDEHGSFTEFAYGAVTRAIRDGHPVIVDEANATDPTDIQKRFNKILQLKPGDTFQIQEDGGERVIVQPGFCIIMTANEKSARYKSVNEFSADFKARFAANVARVAYPDLDVPPGQVPSTLLRLAQATVVDKYGNVPEDNPALDTKTIIKFVDACHRLQRMFSVPLENLQETERTAAGAETQRRTGSGETALKMETIPPRMMDAILDDLVSGGRSGVTLQSVLERFVEGVTDPSDRDLIRTTLQASALIPRR